MFIAFRSAVIGWRRHEATQLPAAGIALEGIHELDGDVWVVQPGIDPMPAAVAGQVVDLQPVGGDREYLYATWDLVNLVVDNVGRSDHDRTDRDRMDFVVS